MGRKTITFLIVSFLVTTASTWHFVDRSKPGWMIIFWGVIGSNASVIGIIVALAQISLLRKEAKIISETSKDTKARITAFSRFGNLASALKMIQEVQIHTRSSKHEMALIRLQDAKIIMLEIKASGNYGDFDPHLTRVNFLLNDFEKEISTKSGSLNTVAINASLEGILDALGQAKAAQMKNH